jgi:hypothetical protein
MTHTYYSHRTGSNPNLSGLPLSDVVKLFVRVYDAMCNEGYFQEAFGVDCTDGPVAGKILDVELAILLSIRKKSLWPISIVAWRYSEDDFFDVIEFLFQHVSKGIDGRHHSFNDCGMHYDTFNQAVGRMEFRKRVNEVLKHYCRQFELSSDGDVLEKPEAGFEPIFEADLPSKDGNVVKRVEAAILSYRRHGSTMDDRRQAVRDLADVLEYLRPKAKALLKKNDESDLFNIANNFGIRHHNDRQKTDYDGALWLSWMFYVSLATIHVLLRKINSEEE